MKCPIDNVDLVMSERSGIEVDYCPKCRGVWLDRGELDKIIERAAGEFAPMPQQPMPAQDPRYNEAPRYEDRRYGDDDDDYRSGGKRRRRESFLGELFDFG